MPCGITLNLGAFAADGDACARRGRDAGSPSPHPGSLWTRHPFRSPVRRAPRPPAGLAGEQDFRARLDEEFARAERHGRALAVIVFGVDAEAVRDQLFIERIRASLRPGSLLAQLADDGARRCWCPRRTAWTATPPPSACAAPSARPAPIAAGVCDLEQALAPRRPAAPRARVAAAGARRRRQPHLALLVADRGRGRRREPAALPVAGRHPRPGARDRPQGPVDHRPLRRRRRDGRPAGGRARLDGAGGRAAGARGARPRRRQDGRARRDAAEADAADAGGARARAAARCAGRPDRRRGAGRRPGRLGALAPRADRRHRLPRPPRGRRDPARRAHHRGRRRVGRDDVGPAVRASRSIPRMRWPSACAWSGRSST